MAGTVVRKSFKIKKKKNPRSLIRSKGGHESPQEPYWEQGLEKHIAVSVPRILLAVWAVVDTAKSKNRATRKQYPKWHGNGTKKPQS